MEGAQATFAAIAERARKAGVVYCIEALSAESTPLINTLEEAARMVDQIHSSSVRTMLDCSAAGRLEKEPLGALIERWVPKGVIAHVQVNDRNRRGPGQGEQRFAPLFAALKRHGYAGDVAVEPFDYVPDGPVAEVAFFKRRVKLRMPFRFGVVTMTQAPQAFVRARIRLEDGRQAEGAAA